MAAALDHIGQFNDHTLGAEQPGGPVFFTEFDVDKEKPPADSTGGFVLDAHERGGEGFNNLPSVGEKSLDGVVGGNGGRRTSGWSLR